MTYCHPGLFNRATELAVTCEIGVNTALQITSCVVEQRARSGGRALIEVEIGAWWLRLKA